MGYLPVDIYISNDYLAKRLLNDSYTYVHNSESLPVSLRVFLKTIHDDIFVKLKYYK